MCSVFVSVSFLFVCLDRLFLHGFWYSVNSELKLKAKLTVKFVKHSKLLIPSKLIYLFSDLSVCICFTSPVVLYINYVGKLLCWLASV